MKSVEDEVKWLGVTTDIAARIRIRLAGGVDLFRINSGRAVSILWTDSADHTCGVFMPRAEFDRVEPSRLADMLVRRFKEMRGIP